jgi:glycosyltransferase involved in cell wall biosynthesis
MIAMPHLSVVLAASEASARRDAFIESLIAQCARARAELIVVHDDQSADLEAITRSYPAMRELVIGGTPSLQDLRAAGMAESTGDVIVLLDDSSTPDSHLLEEIISGVDGSSQSVLTPGSKVSSGGERPYLSIVIPVRNGRPFLRQMLETLCRSELPRHEWELIVVDDGSTDDSHLVASRCADVIIRLPGRSHGPGYARNRGVERARGECLVFLDPDVVVQEDTLSQIAQTMRSRCEVDALFGAYCDEPSAAGIVSQYRNLLHHYTHDQDPGELQSFWAGCGCVRRSVFLSVGMYDEWRFSRAKIEDIELGYRLAANGHHVLLQPEIQVTHLKQWTFREMIRADFVERGVPWARLLAEQRTQFGHAANTGSLRLRAKERSNAALVCAALILLVASVVSSRPLLAYLAAGSIAIVILRGWPLYLFLLRKRGLFFLLCAIVLHLINYVTATVSISWGAFLAVVIGESRPDPAIEAFSELNLTAWPPVPRNPDARAAKAVTARV